MFNFESTYNDVFTDPILGKYAFHLASFANKDKKIVTSDLNPWPEKESIDCLNYLINLSETKHIVYKELSENSSFLLMKQDKPSKLAIVVAGGGYECVCTLPESLPVAVRLYKEGFTALTFTYGIKNKAIHAIDDLNNLIRYLDSNKEELNIDIEDYIIIGFSAGAHLVGLLGTSNFGYKTTCLPKPGLLVLSYPVVTMLEPYCSLTTRRNLLGDSPSLEDKKRYSLELHVDKDFPRTFIWQCDKDNVVDVHNSILMDQALNKAKIEHSYITYPSNVHGYGVATNTVAASWFEKMLSFYNEKCRK